MTAIHGGGVNPRSRGARESVNAKKSPARSSRNAANARLERGLVRDLIAAFDLGDCEIFATDSNYIRQYGVEYPEDYMYAVDTVLRLKHFYDTKMRKGVRYAVFDWFTNAPVTFKQIKDHANRIFKIARTLNIGDEWHFAKQFREHHVHDIAFDQSFCIPLCHLQGFQKSAAFPRLPASERKRFIEARRWLEERTPILVMDLISSKRMTDLKNDLFSRMLNKNAYNIDYASLPPLRNTPVLVHRPSGPVRVEKRGRGRTRAPNGKRRA